MAKQGLISFLCAVGALLSVYALYVEHQKSENSLFEAWCDIAWLNVSCSKGTSTP
jgi:hypothetical protein